MRAEAVGGEHFVIGRPVDRIVFPSWSKRITPSYSISSSKPTSIYFAIVSPSTSCGGRRCLRLGVGALLGPLIAGLHSRLGFARSVMEGAEPFIERNEAVAVVYLEILVVQVVNVGVAVDRGI